MNEQEQTSRLTLWGWGMVRAAENIGLNFKNRRVAYFLTVLIIRHSN